MHARKRRVPCEVKHDQKRVIVADGPLLAKNDQLSESKQWMNPKPASNAREGIQSNNVKSYLTFVSLPGSDVAVELKIGFDTSKVARN